MGTPCLLPWRIRYRAQRHGSEHYRNQESRCLCIPRALQPGSRSLPAHLENTGARGRACDESIPRRRLLRVAETSAKTFSENTDDQTGGHQRRECGDFHCGAGEEERSARAGRRDSRRQANEGRCRIGSTSGTAAASTNSTGFGFGLVILVVVGIVAVAAPSYRAAPTPLELSCHPRPLHVRRPGFTVPFKPHCSIVIVLHTRMFIKSDSTGAQDSVDRRLSTWQLKAAREDGAHGISHCSAEDLRSTMHACDDTISRAVRCRHRIELLGRVRSGTKGSVHSPIICDREFAVPRCPQVH